MKFEIPPNQPAKFTRSGFTLVELLVSMAVLGLLLLLVASIINSASQTTSTGNKRSDADSQARQILDRMSIDFERMVKRPDVDFFYLSGTNGSNTTGNDQIAFYSESTGYYPSASGSNQKSDVSLVGYLISNNANNSLQLMRLSKGLIWNATTVSGYSPMVFGTASPQGSLFQKNWSNTFSGSQINAADPDCQIISPEVFRLAFCFLNKIVTNGSTTYVYQSTPSPNVQQISAVVVALAILDTSSRRVVTNYSSMAGALPDLTASDLQQNPPLLMADKWNSAINTKSFATNSKIPLIASSQVRVYQRMIYLNQ